MNSLHKLPPPLRPVSRGCRLLAVTCLVLLGGTLAAQSQRPLPSVGTLKKMSLEQLMDIEVTSVSKRPEKLSEAASAVQVITGDDIRRSGATSLPEALRFASNLEVAQIDARQWAITARGFNNVFADKMLVLVDGRSVYTPLYAGVYWDVQDLMLEDVNRIEVISGPGATQWGSNAVNGVINVTTKSAKETQGTLVAGGAGTELRSSAAVRYGARLAPDIYYRVSAKYFERDDSVRPSGRNSNDSWHVAQMGFRVDREATGKDPLMLQGDFYNGSIGQQGPDNIGVNGANLLGRWARTLEPNADVKLQAYYDHTHRRIPGSFTQDIDTLDLDFQHHWQSSARNDLVWGVAYRLVRDDIVNTPANAFLPPRVERNLFSAFAEDEIELLEDRVHATVGTKIEHNDYTGFEVEPSVRVAWTLDKRQTVWGAVSRAIRTPSRIDRDLFSPATPPYRIRGGEKVVSEKLLAFETGYRVQLAPGLALSAAAFVNNYGDLRSLEPLTPPLAFPVQASSGLRGRSSGVEFTADWHVTARWRLRAGLTEMRVHSEPQVGTNGDRGTRDSIARDPNRQVSLRSFLTLAEKWECDAAVRYVAPINYQMVPGYTEADLRIGWRPTAAWELSLLGQNLVHGHHAEFNTPGARRELQRAVFVKASWRF